MLLKAFSIRDSKGEVYLTPWFKKTHGEAERDFTELVRDEKTLISKYPEDYDLYFLGEYDDQKGTLIPLDTPQHVVKAAMIKSTVSQ